jgi:hypothetical protein
MARWRLTVAFPGALAAFLVFIFLGPWAAIMLRPLAE